MSVLLLDCAIKISSGHQNIFLAEYVNHHEVHNRMLHPPYSPDLIPLIIMRFNHWRTAREDEDYELMMRSKKPCIPGWRIFFFLFFFPDRIKMLIRRVEVIVNQRRGKVWNGVYIYINRYWNLKRTHPYFGDTAISNKMFL